MSAGAEPAGGVHLGYARASTVRQSLDARSTSSLRLGDAFSEEIFTPASRHPELDAAVKPAGEIHTSGIAVTLKRKRLDRGIELAMLAE
ncbi:hypothetical protein ACIRPX_43035 [Streptomyces sp. NPDC101225]|uniref:hypothetical protein n=1 Tax=Streptomyces sp. NPDC101225 TaxID=3366135 RepID=UPI00382B72E3